VVIWQREESDWTTESREEALVCCALGSGEGWAGEVSQGECCDDTVAAVVPAVGGDVGERANGAVDAVCADEETSGNTLWC
jgi:hypothetical protein